MLKAKDIIVKPISSADARIIVRRFHYSGTVVNNSQLHFGVFINGQCEGAMQFGPPMVKKPILTIVPGTKWSGMLELNRMAFGPRLPKNSESRALGVALRLIKKTYPHIDWILSFADATQCGDGAIYRATGFLLTDIRENKHLMRMPNGKVLTRMTLGKGKYAALNKGKATNPDGATQLSGYMLRYIYFLNHDARARLNVPVIPYARIKELGVGMYLGKLKCAQSKDNVATGFQPVEGGASPTCALQLEGDNG